MTSAVSQLGWGFDSLINWLSDAFNNYIITPLANFFAYIFGALLYGVQMGFFFVIDIVTCVFKKAAGLDVYYQNGEAVSGDLVMQFLQSNTVRAVFISILVAAIILLFITTFIAVLKVEFDEKDNSKGNIFKSALKAIAYFAIVPVVCFLGVIVSNFVLKMLDGATSRDAMSFSTQVFTTSAFNANRVRSDADFAKEIWDGKDGKFSYIPGVANLKDYDQEKIADLIDSAFRSGATPVGNGGVAEFTTVGDMGLGEKTRTFGSFDITNYQLVFYFYNPLLYNYLIGYIGSYMILSILLKLLIGVICRLYELTVLFVLSPLAVSLMPLDGGDRYKAWRGAFIKRVFSAYGPILGLNLVFMVLTLLQSVTLFPSGGIYDLYNSIMQLIFIVTALVSIRSLVDLVTEMVGQGDALKTGEATGKEAKQLGLKVAGQAGNLAATPFRAAVFAGNKLYDNYKRKDAMNDLSYDEAGNVVDPGTEGATRGVEQLSVVDRIKAKFSFVNHNYDDLHDRAKRRSQQFKSADEYIKDGGMVPEYNKEGEIVGKRSVKLTSDESKEKLTDGLKGFWESTPFPKMMDEDVKAAGKGAPIFSLYTAKKKADEKAKKTKDTKEDILLRRSIESKLNAEEEKKRKEEEEKNKKKNNNSGGGNNGGGAGGSGGTTTTSGGLGGTTTTTAGGWGGARSTPTSSFSQTPVTDGKTSFSFGAAELKAESATVNDQKSKVVTGSVDLDNKDVNAKNINADASKVNVNSDEGKFKTNIDGKLKFDDSGIVHAINSSANKANNTSSSILAKLEKISQSQNKLHKTMDDMSGQTKNIKRAVDKIDENSKKKK